MGIADVGRCLWGAPREMQQLDVPVGDDRKRVGVLLEKSVTGAPPGRSINYVHRLEMAGGSVGVIDIGGRGKGPFRERHNLGTPGDD